MKKCIIKTSNTTGKNCNGGGQNGSLKTTYCSAFINILSPFIINSIEGES